MKTCGLFFLFFSAAFATQAQWASSGSDVYLNTLSNSVGIGTRTPAARLEVTGSTATLKVRHSGETDTNWGLQFQQGADLKGTITMSGRDLQIQSGWSNTLTLGAPEYNTYNGKIVFPGGKVGIGTTSPQEKLHVEGNVYVGTNQLQFLSAAGGNNRIFSVGDAVYPTRGAWSFKSRFDDMILDAGETSNQRKIYFRTAGIDRVLLDDNGNVGIGTTSPDAKLAVKGTIHTQEVKVDLLGSMVPDYVFESNYQLRPLESVKTFIDQNKHLPEVPSAKEMETNGMNVGEMNLLLLKKIEELTLYVIELKKELEIVKQNQKD